MTTTWYAASRYKPCSVSPVDVERFTGKAVWINGLVWGRVGLLSMYYPTWAEARDHLLSVADAQIEEAMARIEHAQSDLATAQANLESIASMRPPASADKEIAK